MQTLNGMKHTLLILAGIFTLVAYTSCKKDYACRCIHKYTTTDTVTTIIANSSEKKAEAACKNGNGFTNNMYSCSLQGESTITTAKQ